MNEDIIKGKWKQVRGEIQKKWGTLTDDDMDVIEGDREKLIGKIQERYGIERDKVDMQLKEFEGRWKSKAA